MSKILPNLRRFARLPFPDRFAHNYMPEPNSGCWLWIGRVQHCTPRYAQAFTSYMGKSMLAHRASWLFHRGPIPAGMCVCHQCDVPLCVNPDHLFLGTRKDNQQDMARKGRADGGRTRGAAHSRATINEEIAAEIKRSALSAKAAAQKFGISYHTARGVLRGLAWRHVP